MRSWLLALLLLLVRAGAQTPFPGTAPATFTFKETYVDVVRQEPGSLPEDQSFVIGAQRTLSIKGTAPLTGFDLSQIDENTTFAITVGDFDSSELEGLSGYLTDDETWDPDQTGPSPDRSVDFPIIGYDYDGNPAEIGTVALSWNASQVTFNVSINTVNVPLTEWGFSQGVLAEDYEGDDDPDIGADLPAGFSFGPFSFDLRNVSVVGSVSTTTDDQGNMLSNVSLDGSIDSIAPTITVTQPPPGKATITEADGLSSDFRLTLAGTAVDTRKVGATTYPGTVAKVEVRLGTPSVEGEFDDTNVNLDENGNWNLPNAQLAVGKNVLTFRVTDGDGNTFTTIPRAVTVSTVGPLTIRADAKTGYPAGEGGAAGTVSVTGPTNFHGALTATVNADASSLTRPGVASGLDCTVVAKAKPGTVFDGWEGRLNGTLVFSSASERLVFETKPFLEVTAKFLPNPFAPAVGSYQGLITGDSAAERGLFKVTISKLGAFSGKVQIGALTLPIRGKVLGRGIWFGTVKKGTKFYTVEFTLEIGPDDERTLVGSVTGDGLDADFDADLTNWKKPSRTSPGKLATAQAGTFNVLLPADPANTDPNFPHGIGYGRVTITTLGAVKFVGKLGDCTAVSTSSTLVQRKDGSVFFPLFFAVDKKLGNIAGEVAFEHLAETDLTGALDWMEPASTGIDPGSFAGQVQLSGARYEAPLPGQRVLLEAAGGQGTLTLLAPLFTKPAASARINPSEFNHAYDVTLDPLQNVLATSDVTGQLAAFKFKLKFNPKTGLFAGSYKDPNLNNQTVNLAGLVVRQANGGLGAAAGAFARGNRSGSITIAPRAQ